MNGAENKKTSLLAPKQFEFFARERFRPIPMFPTKAERDRFWSNVEILGDDECWLWMGRRINHYGTFLFKPPISTSRPSHRIAYANETGADIVDFMLCHRCDNPPCVNPRHMFLGTHFHNMVDMYTKGVHRAHKKRTGGYSSPRLFAVKKL